MMPASPPSEFSSRLTAAWALAAQRPPLNNQVRASSVLERGVEILATLSTDGRRGLLILPERREALVIDAEMRNRESAALFAEVAHFSSPGGVPKQGIHVRCLSHGLDEAFVMFCSLVCSRATSGQISSAVSESFEEFRALVGASRARIRPDAIGLVGELLWVKSLIAKDHSAVRSWMGPSGGRHDFRRGQVAVEVKTSLRSSSQVSRIRVSSLDQLVPPEGGHLFLHLIRLEPADDGAISLAGLSNDIRARLSGDELQYFETQLTELGALGSAVDDTFSLLGEETFEIRDGFPRLVPQSLVAGSLPAGIAAVTYEVLLDFALQFRVSRDVAAAALVDGKPQ